MTAKPQQLSNRLRVLRAERRLSQMDAAAQLDISRDRFWKIENGYVDPTDIERRALARLFKVTIKDIFTSQVA